MLQKLLNVSRALYKDLIVVVCVCNKLCTKSFELCNEVYQVYVVAPILFNYAINAKFAKVFLN